MTRYSLFVLKVPLNPQVNKQTNYESNNILLCFIVGDNVKKLT